MNRASLVLGCALFALAATAPSQAFAQTQAGAGAVLSRACQGRAGLPITPAQVAEAMLIESGESPLAFVGSLPVAPSSVGGSLAGAQQAALVTRMREIGATHTPLHLAETIASVEQVLANNPRAVTIENGNGQAIELFGAVSPAWRLVCKPATPPPSLESDPPPPPRFAVRETPEELWLSGDDARKAGALSLAFERTRSALEDGTRKTDTNFTIGGTVGLRLTPARSRVGHVYLFANYELERARTVPQPTLDPGESESDGDTNALAIGLDAILQPLVSDHLVLDINLQGSAVLDFANDASRLRFRAIATPRTDLDLGLCYLGSFSDSTLRGRCEVAAEVQVAQVLRRGTTALGDYDTFLAAGARGGIEFFLPTSPGDDAATGFLASVRYRFLPVLHGAPEDIERLELKLAHRFWTSAGAGIDVGFTYTRGTNELSFEDENVLTFGLGLTY
jgi:hypothetical protein